MSKTKIKLPGYSRYYFDSKGNAFSDATDKPLAYETAVRRPAYRLVKDDARRAVVYVEHIEAAIKEQLKEAKAEAAPKKATPRKAKTVQHEVKKAPVKPEKKAPALKSANVGAINGRYMSLDNARLVRKLWDGGEGKTPKELAKMFNRDAATIRRIINNKIYPEPEFDQNAFNENEGL